MEVELPGCMYLGCGALEYVFSAMVIIFFSYTIFILLFFSFVDAVFCSFNMAHLTC